MYGLIGSFKAAPGKRDELVAILLGAVDAMPGCRSYVVATDPSDADGIWITEVWESAETHQASLGLPVIKAAIAKAMPLIASFGEHREIHVVGGHGIGA